MTIDFDRSISQDSGHGAEKVVGRLDSKVAIVTGAANGIGAATARRLAVEGAAVVVADIDADGAKRQAESIIAGGGAALGVAVDIAEESSVRYLVDAAVSEFGGIDMLHNNASAMNLTPTDVDVVGIDLGVWDGTLRTNLRGTMLCCKAVIPYLLERGGGSVVNTSSGQALVGDTGQTAYGAAKAAVVALSRYIATQYGNRGIRCNAICPGLILTDRLKRKLDAPATERLLRHQLLTRPGQPEDVANLVCFLMSEEGSFITGQAICIDGGSLAHMPSYADGGNIKRS
jgi:NAD(P)-dependent dehydrogenase (short-subunit alcohol dehydrogenase family)